MWQLPHDLFLLSRHHHGHQGSSLQPAAGHASQSIFRLVEFSTGYRSGGLAMAVFRTGNFVPGQHCSELFGFSWFWAHWADFRDNLSNPEQMAQTSKTGKELENNRWILGQPSSSFDIYHYPWIGLIFLDATMNRPSLLLFLLLLSSCAPRQTLIEVNPFLISQNRDPLVIAHGGAKDLWPENTMVAFQGSIDSHQADILEIDVCMTRDGILVCHHDLTIDARSNGSGAVISYDYEELLAFNFGYDFEPIDQPGEFPYRSNPVSIPRLEEVLTRFQGETFFNIELKDAGQSGILAATELYRVLEQYNLKTEVLIASFHDEVMVHFRDISEGEIPTSAGRSETEDFVFSSLGNMEFLYLPHAVAIQVPTSSAGINLASRDIVEAAHRRNMAIHFWTINDKETMRRLIALGADGIITDRPDLLREVLHE